MNMNNTPEQQETAHLEKLRSQISTDIQDMQHKETSLREYEQRLRLLVEHAQSSPAPQAAPPPSLPAGANSESIDAEWEKYRRAHSLLEAARRGLCDDRMALKDREKNYEQREIEIARREAWVKVREQELEAQAQVRAKELEALSEKPKPKRRSSFTVAPLVAARKLLMRHT